MLFFWKNTPRGTTIWNAQLLKFEMEIPGGFKTRVKVEATYQSVPYKVTLPLNSLDKRKKEKTQNHLAKLTAEREVRFLKHSRKLAQNRQEWRTIVTASTALQASRHKSSQLRSKGRGLGGSANSFYINLSFIYNQMSRISLAFASFLPFKPLGSATDTVGVLSINSTANQQLLITSVCIYTFFLIAGLCWEFLYRRNHFNLFKPTSRK